MDGKRQEGGIGELIYAGLFPAADVASEYLSRCCNRSLTGNYFCFVYHHETKSLYLFNEETPEGIEAFLNENPDYQRLTPTSEVEDSIMAFPVSTDPETVRQMEEIDREFENQLAKFPPI